MIAAAIYLTFSAYAPTLPSTDLSATSMRFETLDQLSFPNLSIRIMLSMLEESGIDPSPALEAANLDHTAIEDPNGRVTGRQELDFQFAYVELTGDAPELWFRTGLRYRLPTYGPYGLVLMTAVTLRRGMEISGRFSDLNYSLMKYVPLFDRGRMTGLMMDSSGIPEPLRAFSMHRALGSVTTLIQDMWQGACPLTRIDISLPALEPPERYEGALHTPVTFGAEHSAWIWPPELEDALLPMGDVLLEKTYERQCAEIVGRCANRDEFVTRAMTALVGEQGRYLTCSELAASLAVSERTMHRRLGESNLSYRMLLDLVRYQQARDLLQTSRMSIEQIAFNLGYSEMAAFTHAFIRWSGRSPSSFRRRLVGDSLASRAR
jgi:AraC-like DNA-binding protein